MNDPYKTPETQKAKRKFRKSDDTIFHRICRFTLPLGLSCFLVAIFVPKSFRPTLYIVGIIPLAIFTLSFGMILLTGIIEFINGEI